ncbi:MAG: hypothetical protein GXP38_00415 [Chloroflexi bacterium]|nr:hypothetical protein [Chloroflexota bacterium]
MRAEAKRVLSNWVREATSGIGALPEGCDAADWIADRFLQWWFGDAQDTIEERIRDAETAASVIQGELKRHGGWDKFGDSLHALCHLGDALSELRQMIITKEG